MVSAIEDLLESEGVHAALRYLNSRASHRFTGIYRVDAPTLRNLRLFDRENPMLRVGSDTPMRETYCSLVAASGEPFATADSRADPRLREHPARDSTLAYSGVPLRDETGATWGTLCHFDILPRPVPEEEIAVLEAVAPRILSALREEEVPGEGE